MRNDSGDEEDERRQDTMPATENAPIKIVSAISIGENDPLKNVTIPSRVQPDEQHQQRPDHEDWQYEKRRERLMHGQCGENKNYGHDLRDVTQQRGADNPNDEKGYQHAG